MAEKSSPRREWPVLLLIFIFIYVACLISFVALALTMRKRASRPHVLFIVADDMGWDDLGWTSADMRTPTLDDLISKGVFLNWSYVHPLDSPTRAAFLTGVYPFHVGLQHETMEPSTPAFLPANLTLLPQHLKELGYRTYLIGKWHLGFCNIAYTPMNRGFDSFVGYFTDELDYYTHRDKNGFYDFRYNGQENFLAEGNYSTQVLGTWAQEVITNHDVAFPLFLILSFQALHSPAQVPEVYINESCSHLTDPGRRTMCGMAAALDEAVSNVLSSMSAKGLLDNTLVIFTSDNGGVTTGGSSNGLLRGKHGELWEGGTRVPSFISGGTFMTSHYVFPGLFHAVDWLPTILSLAGGDLPKDIDGIDQWPALRDGSPSPRNEFVYNIDLDESAIRVGDYKLLHIAAAANFSGGDRRKGNDEYHLYDLGQDPGENEDLASTASQKLQELKNKMDQFRQTLVPAEDKPPVILPDPLNYDRVWTPGWC